MFTLRPYQTDLVNRSIAAMQPGAMPCAVGPTGCGKTVIIAEIVRQLREQGQQALVVAHRNEIIRQLMNSLGKHLGKRPGLITASYSSGISDVTVAMVPTLARRKKVVEAMRGRVLIIDEGHHIVAQSYRNLVERMEPSLFLAATATPVAPNGGGLGKYGITELILGPEPAWLMEQGALCRYKLCAADGQVDTAGLESRGGDFKIEQISERVVEVSGSIVRDYRRFNPTQAPTISVCVTIEHANEVCKLFLDEGISAQVVVGDTNQRDRQSAFSRFEKGELKVIVSVALIDEGLDLPAATCLQLIRPTRSLRLWKQLIGRVLRPSDGKEHAIIIDHGGSYTRLPLPDEPIIWSLHDRPKRAVEREEVEIDEETNEVTLGGLVVKEDNRQLREINIEEELAKRTDKRLAGMRKNLYLVEVKGFTPQILWPYAKQPEGIDANHRWRIETALNLPHGWIDENDPSRPLGAEPAPPPAPPPPAPPAQLVQAAPDWLPVPAPPVAAPIVDDWFTMPTPPAHRPAIVEQFI